MRWYGKYPKIKKPEECKCHECGEHFKLIGWISKDAVDNWEKFGRLIGTDPPWENDERLTLVHKRRKNETPADE